MRNESSSMKFNGLRMARSSNESKAKPTHVNDTATGPLGMIDEINFIIVKAKHNKAYVEKFANITKRLSKVLNGADSAFIRQSEFYSDLKETLQKILHHINEKASQSKFIKKLLMSKDQKMYDEIERHVDQLITRIVFAFAQRVQVHKYEYDY